MKKCLTKRVFNENDFKDQKMVKSLTYPELNTLSDYLRKQIIDTVSARGGHLSSNLGSVEICISLFRNFDLPTDKVIFDVGHQCYAYKILSGRNLEFLFRKNGISGFQKRIESPFDCYDAGHSSNSLSAALAFAHARDVKGSSNEQIVVVIGDASIANGLAFEGLNAIGGSQSKIIVVLNDNGMSITPSVGGVKSFFRKISSAKTYNSFKKSFREQARKGRFWKKIYDFSYHIKNSLKRKLISFNGFENLGFTYIGPINGNDIKELDKAFEKAKRTTKPTLIHCKTLKGKGYQLAEMDKTGFWHAPGRFKINDPKAEAAQIPSLPWQILFSSLVEEKLRSDPNSMLICPATSFGSRLQPVFLEFPKQCVDCGIAEEHAATFCGALSLNGFHPILSVYSTFLQRAYDEISHDCARMGANLTILLDRCGLVGKDGETHQGIYDEAYLKSIPNTHVWMPSNVEEAEFLFNQSFEQKGVNVIRITCEDTIPDPIEHKNPLEIGRFHFYGITTTQEAILLCVGARANVMVQKIKNSGTDVEIACPLFLNDYKKEEIDRLLPYKQVFIYDAYSTKEGFCSSILSDLMEKGYQGKVKCFCVPNSFIPFSPNRAEQEKELQLDPDQVFEQILGSVKHG